MDELIIKSLRGAATQEEELRLAAWRSASAENRERYQEVAALWRVTASARHRGRGGAPSAADLLERGRTRTRRRWRRAIAGLSITAAAAVAGFLVAHTWFTPQREAFAATELVTGSAETATATLGDGTVVRLAPETRLVFTGRPGTRDVTLEGRAFFAVTPDPDRPFRVRTPTGTARVLGTRFDLSASHDGLRLVVVEGRVEVGAGDASVELTADQVGHVARGSRPSVVQMDDTTPLLSWMGRFLAFQSTPLHQVAAEIEAKYSVDVEITDEALERRTVTAWFSDKPLESVVVVVCRVVEAQCTLEGTRVVIDRQASRSGTDVPVSSMHGGST